MNARYENLTKPTPLEVYKNKNDAQRTEPWQLTVGSVVPHGHGRLSTPRHGDIQHIRNPVESTTPRSPRVVAAEFPGRNGRPRGFSEALRGHDEELADSHAAEGPRPLGHRGMP